MGRTVFRDKEVSVSIDKILGNPLVTVRTSDGKVDLLVRFDPDKVVVVFRGGDPVIGDQRDAVYPSVKVSRK